MRDRAQQLVRAVPAGEPDRGQHVRGELAQVGHRGIQHRQVPVIAGQPLAAGRPRRPHPLHGRCPRAAARPPGRRPISGSSTIVRMSSSSACRSSPALARSASASVIRSPARPTPAPTAPGRTAAATSSSTSTADCATSVSRIGYRRSGSRRSNACAVSRRPSLARNRRRSAGSTDRSSVCASSPRRNASFSSSSFTAAGVAATGPGPQPRQPRAARARDRPTSSPSSSAPAAAGQQRARPASGLRLRPLPRRRDALQDVHHARAGSPATEIRYSHASRNSSFGESCSIARANRNSSSSFHSTARPTARQPRYWATSRR